MIRKLLLFFQPNPKKSRAGPSSIKRTPKLVTKGDYYDLEELYEEVNTKYFEGKLQLDITWAGQRDSMPRTRVMFGSYHHEKKLIKIHRRLDQAHIPHFFISFVVYHEMLHHVLPPLKKRKEKRRIHHASFTEKEREFQEYSLVLDYRKKMRRAWFSR